MDTDHRLNWSRRGGHGDVGAVDDLQIGRRADARQDGIQHCGLAARVAHGVTNDHLVAAHVFRLKVVDRVGRLRGPLDVLVVKTPLVGERLGALGLNRQFHGRSELHNRLVCWVHHDHRRVIRLKRHVPPPRTPAIPFVVRDALLVSVARLGIHLNRPHVGVVVGINLRRAVVAPAIPAIGTQLDVRCHAGLEQRRLAHLPKRIASLAIGVKRAGVGILCKPGITDQHIVVFVHRNARESVLLHAVGILNVAALNDRGVRLQIPPLHGRAIHVGHTLRQKHMVRRPEFAVALDQCVHARVVAEDVFRGAFLR